MIELIDSFKYLIVMAVAWFGAHFIKFLIALKRQEYKTFFLSGGMPSAHSALVVALATLVGCTKGITSTNFALALALAMIVTYDAMHVRRMAAQTAEAINLSQDPSLKKVAIYNGHSGIEVFVGTILGVAVALVVFFATK